jgi:biopolymer transport protein ExbD
MKKRHMPDMKEGGVNVTPLIDIVMVLIIFFMLVAKIGVSRGVDDSIPLPSSILGKKLESMSNTLTLNVHWNRGGEEPQVTTQVDGKMVDLPVKKKYASGSVSDLDSVLNGFAKANAEKANIIIRADRDLPYHQLELVLLACATAGIGNVSYETKAGADEPAAPAAAATPN